MPPDIQGVKPADSPAANPTVTPSAGGQQPSPTDRTMEQVMEENKRKAEELAELKEQVQELMSAKEDRAQELQDKPKLSESEKAELITLEQQIASIKADARAKPWFEIQKDISTDVARANDRIVQEEMAEDLIEDLAEKEKMPQDKFERVIIKYMKQVDPTASMNPYRRAKRGYKEYLKHQSMEKRIQELEQREKSVYVEPKNTPAPPQSRREILEDASKSDDGMSRVLKGISEVQKVQSQS